MHILSCIFPDKYTKVMNLFRHTLTDELPLVFKSLLALLRSDDNFVFSSRAFDALNEVLKIQDNFTKIDALR